MISEKILEDKLIDACGVEAAGLMLHLMQWDSTKSPGNRARFQVFKIPEMPKEPPIVVAGKDKFSSVFDCPFCKRKHTHGFSNGHRLAHCDPHSGSPFLLKGYTLQVKDA